LPVTEKCKNSERRESCNLFINFARVEDLLFFGKKSKV